jgi:thioredoxin reductase
VLATGPGSAAHAHLLRQWSDDVILFTHRHPVASEERATLDARAITVVDGVVERLVVRDDRLDGVRLADGRVIPRAALFIRPALRAHAGGPATILGCDLDADGLVRADADGRASLPGVWAAGNAANPRAQVITAAGEGSAVAIAINAELIEDDVATARQRVAAAHAA